MISLVDFFSSPHFLLLIFIPFCTIKANSDDEGNGEGGTTDKSHGLTTVTSTTSVHDYFAKKMREIKARQAKSTEMEEVSDDVQKHNESKTGLKMKAAVYGMVGFSYCDTENEKNSDNDNSGDFRNKSEGRSSRGWYQSWDLNQNEGEIALNGDKHSSMKPKAKKKKKDKKAKRNDVDEGETVVCIAAEESVESATLCDKGVEQKESSKKKKKLKNKHDTSLNLDADSHNETKVMLDAKSIGSGGVLELNNKGSSVSVDQKFERNKNEEGDSVNLVAENAVQCEDTDSFSKKKKKKRKAYEELEDHLKQETKKRKTSCEVTEMANKDLLIGLDEGNLKENKTKKKKRRKGKDLPDSGNCDGRLGSDIKENSQHGNSEEKPSEISSAEKKKWKRLKKDASNDFKNENSKLANDTVVIPSPNPAATVNGTRNNKNTSHEAQKSPSNLFKPRGTQGKKKKKKLSKQKKSIFPGSNLEDLNGYAVVKTDSEEKVKKIKKSSKIKKRGFICARDVDDKLRKIAKVHGGMVGKSESVRS